MIYIGKISLWLAVFISFICLIAIPFILTGRGRKKQSQLKNCYWGLVSLGGLLTLSTLVLTIGFITNDYSFQYVASYSSPDMHILYRIAAVWAGQEGSMLFWAWLVAVFTAIIAFKKRSEIDKLNSYALLIMNIVLLFFLVVMVADSDPFVLAPLGVAAGRGINPLLLHWAMTLHPSTLFIGYAGLTIPFAYGIAALLIKDSEAEWVKRSQKWTLFSWLFLGIGIYLGAVWAYVVLGWGGYWGWDPVENASFLPWLTGTALVHSFTVYRRRGGFKLWSLSLAAITFLLVIFGTFVTRSGVIQSVHAFEQNPLMTALFGSFMAIIILGSAGLIISRLKEFSSEEPFESLFSKEFLYYLNNIILLVSTFIIVGATVVPPLTGGNLGPGFYNQIARPLGFVYVLILALCPLFAWRKTNLGRFGKSLLYPGILGIASIVPLYFYWESLEDQVKTVSPGLGQNFLGYIGLIVAAFSIFATIYLFTSWANQLKKQTGKNYISAFFSIFKKSRSRSGGYLVHFSVAIMLLGLVGSSIYATEVKSRVKDAGDEIKVANYTLKYKGSSSSSETSRDVTSANFDVYNSDTNELIGEVSPRTVFYKTQQQQTREVDILYELFRDIFVILEGQNSDGSLGINVFVNPLVSFVWVGGAILIIGSTIALWPKKKAIASEGAKEVVEEIPSRLAKKRKKSKSWK
ncbi:MAG: heme lyase CcmF/NrfE family subunit [Actinobacteria bacterium]|nr:heme lyase CcmF/NrfE family subunit [Actinomycetota bacterium]